MTLYRSFFEKEKKKFSDEKWCYSECDIIEGDVIERGSTVSILIEKSIVDMHVF